LLCYVAREQFAGVGWAPLDEPDGFGKRGGRNA
jgi:hypothetical protein